MDKPEKTKSLVKMEFRRASDEEIEDIRNNASIRKGMEKEERLKFSRPSSASLTYEGALFWAIIEKWQDRPFFVAAGIAAIAWNITMLLFHLIRSIAHLI